METLKIAMIAPEFLPNWGGVGTYCIELSRKLCDKVELHVLTVNRNIDDSKKGYSKEEMEAFFDGQIKVHVLSDAKNTFLYNATFQHSLFKHLPEIVKDHGIDLLHTQHAHMSDVLYKLMRKRVPSITTLHTTISGQKKASDVSDMKLRNLEPSEKWQIALYPMLLMAEKFSLRRCPNYITMSNWMKGQVQAEFPFIKHMNVIYNGTDPSVFKPRDEKVLKDVDSPIVLFTSRMTAVKGANYLIDAIPLVLKEHKDVHFAFVGAGDKEPYKDILKKNGVGEKHYSFHGYLDYEQLPAMYSQAFCYMLPTLYENFPIRMLEAMSSGSPVIASNICGIPEAVNSGRNGILVKPKDHKAIAHALIQMLSDEKKTKFMGQQAREDVKAKFTWDICANRTLECYRQALQG
ncbi:MAG: glycosyltransferase family 4 protein [Thermoplasmata archaeon]